MHRLLPAAIRLILACISLALSATITACDLTTSTTTPSPSPTPKIEQIQGDGQLNPEGFYHDSRDGYFRDPTGPVVAGTEVTLRLKTAPRDPTSAEVRLWNSAESKESILPMQRVADDTWEVKVQTPTEGAALWYRFQAKDGMAQAYYNDNSERDGGPGEGRRSLSENDYVITAYRSDFKTPDWLKGGVIYQIFPDRFNNAEPANDKPDGSFIYGGNIVKRAWGDAPTGGNDFFGGDLKGITARLDYLRTLGVTAIYLNPIFASPSNHRYDTTDYTQIEPSLGTLADFRELVAQAEQRDMKLILDGVFNHSSSDSLYFDKFKRYPTEGAAENKSSPYFAWYRFREWPATYESWAGFDTLPTYTESDAVKDFLFRGADSVASRWMGEGAGGWRLDAAEQKSYGFWRDLRTAVKAKDPEAVIIGEFWQNSAPWLAGDQWDGTMNYRFKDAVLGWLGNKVRPVETMAWKLDSIREDYPPQALAVSMNIIGTHDTRRALTEALGDKNMLRLMALMQYTWPGLPTVYYGDEAGMEGRADPDNRRTYPWGAEDASLIEFYRMLASTREANNALRNGDLINLGHNNEQDVYAYARKSQDSAAIIVLNRSEVEREVTLPITGVLADGQPLADQMNTGATYAASDGRLVVKVPARWGVLLVPK